MQVHKGTAELLADVSVRLELSQLLFQGLRPDDALFLFVNEEVVEVLQILFRQHRISIDITMFLKASGAMVAVQHQH